MKLGIFCFLIIFLEIHCVVINESCLKNLTAGNFQQKVEKSDKTWFVKFYAPWCGHCKHMHPAWVDLAQKYCDENGKIQIGQVNADEETELSSQFDIQGFPTLILFKDGKMYKYKGERTVEKFAEFIEKPKENDTGDKIPGRKTMLEKAWSFVKMVLDAYIKLMDQVGMEKLPRGVKMGIIIAFFISPLILIPFCLKAINEPAPIPMPKEVKKEEKSENVEKATEAEKPKKE